MTRIIAGTAGGRRLETPRGTNTRPTSDRVREALFSAIESWAVQDGDAPFADHPGSAALEGLRFLDLYAGSGAVGLEARSRGAGVVTLVEHDRRTAQLIRGNVRKLDLTRVEVLAASVAATLARIAPTPYDVVFADPPYPVADEDVEQALEQLVANGWLATTGLVVVERSARGSSHRWPAGIRAGREKKYGETVLRYGHAAPPEVEYEAGSPDAATEE